MNVYFFLRKQKKGRVVRRERQSKERQEIEIAENERHLPQNSNRTPSRRKSNKNRKKNCKKIDFPKSRVNLPPIKKCLEERLGLKVLARCQDFKKTNKMNHLLEQLILEIIMIKPPKGFMNPIKIKIFFHFFDINFFKSIIKPVPYFHIECKKIN